MKTPLTLAITATFLVVACTKSSDSKRQERTPTVVIENPLEDQGITVTAKRITELADDLSNIDEFKKGLNQYQIIFTMPPSVASNISISRLNTKSGSPEVVDSSSPQIEEDSVLIKDYISLDKEFLVTHKFRYAVSLNNQSFDPVEVSLKPDLIISGKTIVNTLSRMSADIEVGALIVTDGSSLITLGQNISIHADTLMSENGMIETFTTEDSLAAMSEGEPGADGGHIVIDTEFFTGDLKFFLRGKKGGKGVDGLPIHTRPEKAANGKNSAEYDGCAQRGESGYCDYLECPSYAEPGAAGIQGEKGNDGRPGGHGGDSGYVTFTAKKANTYKVHYDAIPGKGGEPGSHGFGGKGGEGGDGGESRTFSCGRGREPNGPMGADGPDGIDGPRGEDGKIQKSTFTINGQSENGEN